jgi:hypothetical protein
MPPLPVIANVYRVAFPFSGGAAAPTTVINVRSTAATNEAEVGAAIDAARAHGSFTPWYPVSSAYSCPAMHITKLDGTSATVVVPLSAPISGAVGGEEILEGAVVVSIRTAQRGARGRGRVFLGPITESVQNGGVVQATPVTNTLAEWNSFFTHLASDDPVCDPGVASYVHADFHVAQSVSVDPKIGIMKRRLLRAR